MEAKTKRRIKDGITGLVYGTAAYGSYWLLLKDTPSTVLELKEKNDNKFNNINNELSHIIVSDLTSKEQFSQLKSKIINSEGKMRGNDEHNTILMNIAGHVNTLSHLYDASDIGEQNYVKTTLINMRDQLNHIRSEENKDLTLAGSLLFILGGALLLTCGYKSARKIYEAIIPSKE